MLPPYLYNGIFIRKSYGEKALPLATECIKRFVIPWCLYIVLINVEEYESLPVQRGILTQHMFEGKLRDSVRSGPPLRDSFIRHTFLLSVPLSASVYEYIHKMI